jgi:PKD repeat protein
MLTIHRGHRGGSSFGERRWSGFALATVVFVVVGFSHVAGDGKLCAQVFLPDVEVGDGVGQVAQSSLAIDVVNAHITSVIDGKIYHRVYNSETSTGAFVTPDETAGQGDPSSVASSLGQVFVFYAQEDSRGGVGREILLSKLSGQGFLEAENLSNNSNDEFAPQVELDLSTVVHATWERNNSGTSEVVYYTSRSGGLVTPAGAGSSPRLAVDENSDVHLISSRAGDLIYQTNSSGSFAAENEIPVVSVSHFNTSIGVSAAGKVFVTYESQGRLFLTTSTGSAFDTPREIDANGVSGSSLFVSPDGRAFMAYSLLGDIVVAFDFPANRPDAVTVTDTLEVESSPDLQVNPVTGDIHLTYIRDGRVYYTNNAPPPIASFEATPMTGDAPLEVQFTDHSSGQVLEREWTFDDGQTSDEVKPVHLFQFAGAYVVTLRLTGPGGTDETSEIITVVNKENFLTVPPIELFRGQTDVLVPINGTYTVPITAYTIVGQWDPAVLDLKNLTQNLTHTGASTPDLFEILIDDTPGGEHFLVAMIVGFDPSGEGGGFGQVLPLGTEVRLVNAVVDVRDDIVAPQVGPFFTVEETVGTPTVDSIFTALGQVTLRPETRNHPWTIHSELGWLSLIRIFRGDVNKSGLVDISDAINLLDFLFLGGFPLLCHDLADVDDNGQADVTDVISTLVFLFLGGNPPAFPYPGIGPDATEDSLPGTLIDCSP